MHELVLSFYARISPAGSAYNSTWTFSIVLKTDSVWQLNYTKVNMFGTGNSYSN